MASFIFIIWFLIVLAAVIGAMRGWSKELLVLWAGVLALFIIQIAEQHIVYIAGLVEIPENQFWFRTGVMVLMIFFGYETPRISYFTSVTHREKLEDSLLGLFFGGVNGWLFFGSVWAFLHKVNYLLDEGDIYQKLFVPPVEGTVIGDATLKLLSNMPPELGAFGAPGIYIVLAIVSIAVVVLLV